MQGQGRSRNGGGGGGGGYHYRHGYQPYAAGWHGYGAGFGNHQMAVQGGFGPVYARGGVPRGGILPLGVHGAGILKRPVGPPQGPLMYGRGHQRGRGRGGRGGRGRGGRDKERDKKPLTKEALDADLDEWRMKDKKLGGQSLDAELDDYWKNKEDEDPTKDDGELLEPAPAEVPAASKPDASKGTKPAAKKSNGARALDRSNGEAPESSKNGVFKA